jgi:butyrate kinase
LRKTLLIINPGSTSTKVAIYDDMQVRVSDQIDHDADILKAFPSVHSQFDFRKEAIERWLARQARAKLSAVVARGGMLRPLQGGCYEVDSLMKEDLRVGIQGEHASNLGGLIADALATPLGIPAYIVDPVSVDEFDDVARLSGVKEIPRKSLLHALNIRSTARRAAHDMGREMEECNFVIAHLGGGFSITAMRKGKMIDVNNANEEGPFSPERAGSLPCFALAKLCFSGKFRDFSEARKIILGQGGIVAYLGTSDVRQVIRQIEEGDAYAERILNAMVYQIAKYIGSMAAALKGEVDAVILTGGIAYSSMVTQAIEQRVRFIAPVHLYPGENEMASLAAGALRVLRGEESVKKYIEEGG